MTPAERTAHAIVAYAQPEAQSQAALEKAVALVSQAIREENEACARICVDRARQLRAAAPFAATIQVKAALEHEAVELEDAAGIIRTRCRP